MLVSLQRGPAVGSAVGAVAAFALALVVGRSRVGENVVDPLRKRPRTSLLFGLILVDPRAVRHRGSC